MKKKLALFLLLAGCASGRMVAQQTPPDCPPSDCDVVAVIHGGSETSYVCRAPGEPRDLDDLVRRRQQLERQQKCKALQAAQELE